VDCPNAYIEYRLFSNISQPEQKIFEFCRKKLAVFTDSYKKASEMIPEWEEEFDLKAANKLKESVLAKNLEKLETASEALQKTCSHCHSIKHERLDPLSLTFNKHHKGIESTR
jgi:hypothetical protein